MNAWYKLRDYIKAESLYRDCKTAYLQARSEVYSLTSPQLETYLGFMVKVSLSVENAVIHLEESEEQFKKDIQPLQENRKKLAEALSVLNIEERQVFFALAFNDEVQLSNEFIKKHEKTVVNKLCRYIECNHLEVGLQPNKT